MAPLQTFGSLQFQRLAGSIKSGRRPASDSLRTCTRDSGQPIYASISPTHPQQSPPQSIESGSAGISRAAYRFHNAWVNCSSSKLRVAKVCSWPGADTDSHRDARRSSLRRPIEPFQRCTLLPVQSFVISGAPLIQVMRPVDNPAHGHVAPR